MQRKRKNPTNIVERNKKSHLKMNPVKAVVVVTVAWLLAEQAAAVQLVTADHQLQVMAERQVPQDRLMVVQVELPALAELVETVELPMLLQ
jgi:hypothetical protein